MRRENPGVRVTAWQSSYTCFKYPRLGPPIPGPCGLLEKAFFCSVFPWC